MKTLRIWACAICFLTPLSACESDPPEWAAAEAVSTRNTNALEKLLNNGVSPDAIVGGRPLIRIAMEGSGGEYSADVLLAHGAHINLTGEDGVTALMEVSGAGIQRVDYLLHYGAKPNQADAQGNTALFYVFSDSGWGGMLLASPICW